MENGQILSHLTNMDYNYIFNPRSSKASTSPKHFNQTTMNYYISVLKKYAVFNGRASRAEYWYFALFNAIITLALGLIEVVLNIGITTNESVLANIYQLAVLIPAITVGIRRMHDVDKSGWFLLIPIYSFILAVTEGTRGKNKYDPNPKIIE